MHVERHPYSFDVCTEFSNASRFAGWEGGAAYRADRGGKAFIIIDEGTVADFLNENEPTDREVLNQLVSVLEFENEVEREAYIVREMSEHVEREQHRLER